MAPRDVDDDSAGGDKSELKHIGFKADAETLAALARLIDAAQGKGLIARQSTVIRRAIIEAAARLSPSTQ